MKHRIITYGLIVLVSLLAFLTYWSGLTGRYISPTVQAHIFPKLHTVASAWTDLKFRLRGPVAPKEKIVIVGIDPNSLQKIGRWPWRRDVLVSLLDGLFALGARGVGLDLIFSEPQESIPEQLKEILRHRGEEYLVETFDFDSELGRAVTKYRDRVVLEWHTESPCRQVMGECPAGVAQQPIPKGFEKFSIADTVPVHVEKTPLLGAWQVLPPFSGLMTSVDHAGFPNALRDEDGITRNANLLMHAGEKLFPSFALSLASLVAGRPLSAKLDSHGEKVELLSLGERRIPVSASAVLELNLRGEQKTFPHIGVWEVFEWAQQKKKESVREIASEEVTRRRLLENAIVLVGATAAGLGDVHATPFDSMVPGVEIQANILDNILAGDGFVLSPLTAVLLLVLMLGGAGLILLAGEKWEGRHFLAVLLCFFSSLLVLDYVVLFRHGQNAPTIFLYLEILALAAACLVFKYLEEEQKRKFIRSAFAKYVSPAVVDSLIKDPAQLSLGGRRETLTILFSDIRGFTTFSERVDAKLLSQFLNEFHGMMTDEIFKKGGTLDKYIGDAVMAFWGAPLFQPDHAHLAATAAVQMLGAVRASQAKFEAAYGFCPKVGIGLHTGVVSVGNMGSEKSFGYTVIGDTVNLASRLEGASKYFGTPCLTTQSTLQSIAGAGLAPPPHRVIGPIKVKGKSENVIVVELLTEPLPEKAMRLFEEGKAFFRQKRWDEARATFQEVQSILPKDGPSLCYLHLCEELRSEKLPEPWDGSWALHEK